MKRSIKLVLVILFSVIPARAQQPVVHRSPLRHVTHYVATHKRLLISDALILGAQAADTASTIHCMNASPHCVEGNPILGHHPSHAALWGYSLGFGAFLVGIDHTVWWLFGNENDKDRWLIYTNSVPLAISGYYSTKHNVNEAEYWQARQRVTTR